MEINDMPITNVKWVDVNSLTANDYNPNVVLSKEMELLKLSILKNGWIQPILITNGNVIIDGFHRVSLAKFDSEVNKLTAGKVPVVIMDLNEPERILLTVRINRAKGQHVAIKMHELVTRVIQDYGLSIDEVCRQIGANRDEIELLLAENVFKKYDITKETKYSKAWIPKYKTAGTVSKRK